MAQPENTIIRSIFEPTLTIDEMAISDIDEGTKPGTRAKGEKLNKMMGSVFPMIMVNGYIFNMDEILSLNIDCTGFLPLATVKVQMVKSSIFISKALPKDDDKLSIFIRSRNDLLKPIRNDYLITSVSTSNGSAEGEGMVLTMSGPLDVPGIYDEQMFSFEGTSFDCLKRVCKNLGLGFATNETSTSDSQIWLCPNDNFYNFIRNIVSASWKNEECFYRCFIDNYYHLNFININNQMVESNEPAEAIIDQLHLTQEIYDMGDNQPLQDSQKLGKKLFTNLHSTQDTPFYIGKYRLINNSSNIAKKYGYKMHAQFYDQASRKNWDIYVEPLSNKGAADSKILLKGRPGESNYKTLIKKKWLGIQYANMHEKYMFATIHNLMNNQELEKLQVEIEVPRANFNIYMCERVPCVFMVTSNIRKIVQLEGEGNTFDAENGGAAVDNFYTGWYMVNGMKFKYEIADGNTRFTEKVLLTRREWPAP